MVEYGLMVALIAVIAVPGIAMVGHETGDTFNVVAESLAAGDGGNGGNETPAPGGDSDDSPAPGDDDDSPAPGDDDDSPAPGDDDDSPAPGGDEDDAPPVDPGSEAVVASSDSSFFWWNDSKQGGEGAWKATVQYGNDHNRHQYLTLEITRTDDKGNTTTSRVNEFYVPANGNATYELWDNDLKLHNGRTTGVLTVEVQVISVTTADENWQPVTYPQYNKSTTVDAPTP